MECLVGLGAGLASDGKPASTSGSAGSVKAGPQQQEDEEDEFAHLDPDECPTLVEAAKVLFPVHTKYGPSGLSSTGLSAQRRVTGSGVEDELAYVAEMAYRSKEVCSFSHNSPFDLYLLMSLSFFRVF